MNDFFPWHEAAWRQLQQMLGRLPHAILLHGPQGTGKTAFAEAFAQSLLCTNRHQDGRACGACEACGWFAQYAHPDYRRVRPEALDDEPGEGGEGEDGGDGDTKKSAKSKTPSKEIKIDQIRALGDFMNVSTHRQGLRVVLLYPAEALNTMAANALLKTLEEPPPATVFILVSHAIERLLPTILSRCRKFALPMPPRAQALAWLKEQGVADADDWLAEQGGAPLSAIAASASAVRELQDEFLRALARPDTELALKTAERLQKAPVSDLVLWQQRWLYDVLAHKLSGTIRYYPRYRRELESLSRRAPAAALLAAVKRANERRAVAEHPLAARLFIEDLLLDYTAVFAS
ncbi:MAG TPA: DNA polymerase III subunit delta' [Noviherbaspirillum sp.]|nr:DNA polymerase III subunit delta' [Noviherbaspirillum sp.]